MWFGDLVFKPPTQTIYVRRRITIANIQHTVCQQFDVSIHDLLSNRRTALISLARHMAMCLARDLTDLTFEEISRRFNRDHSSVMSGIYRMSVRIKVDPNLAIEYQALKAKFQ